MDTILVVEKSEIPGIAIQCELLLPNGHLQRNFEFDITNIGLRRRLVRRFYGILIVGFPLSIFESNNFILLIIKC